MTCFPTACDSGNGGCNIFANGFESGDLSAWMDNSASDCTGGGCKEFPTEEPPKPDPDDIRREAIAFVLMTTLGGANIKHLEQQLSLYKDNDDSFPDAGPQQDPIDSVIPQMAGCIVLC